MDPSTMVTAALSSLVPCPNASSVLSANLSVPVTRLGALAQSVLPVVLTTRLPSPPSKVLPVRLAWAEAAADSASTSEPTPTSATARLRLRLKMWCPRGVLHELVIEDLPMQEVPDADRRRLWACTRWE